MIKYEVMSEQEAMQERFQLLKEGVYDAVISASMDTISATSGNPMMAMTVSVYDENGKSHDIKDFLVFTKALMWKVIHFSDSAGVLKEYAEGKLCSDVAINKRVKVKIVVEEGNEIPQDKLKGKPLGSKYFDKNKIDDYVKKSEWNSVDKKSSNNFQDDEVPFL